MGKYVNYCGPKPTEAHSVAYRRTWWTCAANKAEEWGVCSTKWSNWWYTISIDVKNNEGFVYYDSIKASQDGDYVNIYYGDAEVHIGKFKWKCPEEKAKACKVSSEPSASKNVDVGVNVPVNLVIENCGTVAAPMGSSIEKDGVEIVSVYKDMINPGGTFEISTSFSMPNKVTNLKFEGYAWVNGAWSLDVNFTYTLTPMRECEAGETKCVGEDLYWCRDGIWTLQQYGAPQCKEAKGEITLCNINGSSCPNCGQANQGDEISVIAEMKNVGAVKGKFMFYVLDQHGNELSKAGGIGYKDVEAGETWKVTPASWDDLDFKMPSSAIIEGHLKLARLE